MNHGKEDSKSIGYDPESGEIPGIDALESTPAPVQEILSNNNILPNSTPTIPKRVPKRTLRDSQNEVVCRVPRESKLSRESQVPQNIIQFPRLQKSPNPKNTS